MPLPYSHYFHSTSHTQARTSNLTFTSQSFLQQHNNQSHSTITTPYTSIKIPFSSTNMSHRSTNTMSRYGDSTSGMSRYGDSRSRGADSHTGYSHGASSRSHTHSSRGTTRGYDDDSADSHDHDSDDDGSRSRGSHSHSHSHGGGSSCPRGGTHRRRENMSEWYEATKARIDREMAAEAAERERQESRYTDSRSFNDSHGGSYGGSADYSGYGGSASHSSSSRRGTTQPSRGPSTYGDSAASRDSRSSRRITGGHSSGGRSSHASHGGYDGSSTSREIARRY